MEILWGIALFLPIVLSILLCMGQWRRWPVAALALWPPTILPFLNSLTFAVGGFTLPLWSYLVICFLPLAVIGLRRMPHAFIIDSTARSPLMALRRAPSLAAIIVIILLITLAATLAPEVRGDSIIYHISAAMLFSVNERMIEIPTSILTYIPQAQQLFYAICLDAHSETLARLLHWFEGILLLAGTYEIARYLKLSKQLSLSAALLLLLVPVWTYLSTSTYVDLATAVWTLAAFFVLLIRPDINDKADRKAILIAGCLAGAAISTKYTAILTGLLPLGTVLCVQQWQRIRHQQDTKMISLYKIFLFFTIAFIVYSPWLIRNYIWTGNPVCPSFMTLLGPASVPQTTLSWGDIQPGPKYTVHVHNIWLLLATMFFSLSSFGNYLPMLAAILGIVCFGVARRRAFPRPINLILTFLATAYILGVTTGALRNDSRYIMAHVGLLAVLCVYWFQFLLRSCPQQQKLFLRIGVVCLTLMVIAYGRTTMLMFRDLNESIIPPITAQARDQYRTIRLRKFTASMKLANSDFVRNEYDNGKILGVSYPARMNYILGGQPIAEMAALPEPEALTPQQIPMLKANGINWVYGTVTPQVAALLQPRLTMDGITLYAVPRN